MADIKHKLPKLTNIKHELPKPVCEVCGKTVQVKEDGTAIDAKTNRNPITKQIKGYTCKECEAKTRERTKQLIEGYVSGKTDRK
jgi:uncharacterized protein YlaI